MSEGFKKGCDDWRGSNVESKREWWANANNGNSSPRKGCGTNIFHKSSAVIVSLILTSAVWNQGYYSFRYKEDKTEISSLL